MKIQLRRDTASNWITNNPTLASGEIGIETDTSKFKIGDGTTSWTALDYAGGGSELDKYLSGSTTDSTTTLSTGDKALALDAPTIAVGDNLVNEINGENSQLYLKQGDFETEGPVTIDPTATGVKVKVNTYSKDEEDALLAKKGNDLSPVAPISIKEYVKSNLVGFEYTTDATGIYASPYAGGQFDAYRSGTSLRMLRFNRNLVTTDASGNIVFNSYIDIPYTIGQILNIKNEVSVGSTGDTCYLGKIDSKGQFIPITKYSGTIQSDMNMTDDITFNDTYIYGVAGGNLVTSYASITTNGNYWQLFENADGEFILCASSGNETYARKVTDTDTANRLKEINCCRIIPFVSDNQGDGIGSRPNIARPVSSMALYNSDKLVTDYTTETEPEKTLPNLFDLSSEQKLNYLELNIGDGLSVVDGKLTASGGGGSAPDNMMTTDTDQEYTGQKVYKTSRSETRTNTFDQDVNFLEFSISNTYHNNGISIQSNATNAAICPWNKTILNINNALNHPTTNGNATAVNIYGTNVNRVRNGNPYEIIDTYNGDSRYLTVNGATQDINKDVKFRKYISIEDDQHIGWWTNGNAVADIGPWDYDDGNGQSMVFKAQNGAIHLEASNKKYLMNTEAGTEEILTKSKLPIASDTQEGIVQVDGVTIVSNDGVISVVGGGSSTSSNDGIKGDYSTHYGILDCPNGLIEYNATGKDITVKNGIVLQCAGSTSKTTIASDITATLTSSGTITLFYAGGEVLECGKVDYQETEPTDNGVDNYQAWFKPSLGKWQLKSNDTGNVWREVVATPIANINLNDSNITRVDYIGYRILDDDILVDQSQVESIQDSITTLTTNVNALGENLDNCVTLTGVQTINGEKKFWSAVGVQYIKPYASGGSITIGTSTSNTISIKGQKIRLTDSTNGGAVFLASDSDGKLSIGDTSTTTNEVLTTANVGPYAAHAAMPSNNVTNLTLGSTGATYTAPTDGYFSLAKKATAVGQYILLLKENNIGVICYSPASNANPRVTLQCSAGDVIRAEYSCTGDYTFRFVKANGAL